jgi:hypothetical protein
MFNTIYSLPYLSNNHMNSYWTYPYFFKIMKVGYKFYDNCIFFWSSWIPYPVGWWVVMKTMNQKKCRKMQSEFAPNFETGPRAHKDWGIEASRGINLITATIIRSEAVKIGIWLYPMRLSPICIWMRKRQRIFKFKLHPHPLPSVPLYRVSWSSQSD